MPAFDPFANLNALELPDLWQQDGVRFLREGYDVIVDAPTGAGKTKIFELLVEARNIKGQAIYTVPTRALANDKFREWQSKGWNCGIATGDIAENVDAPVVVATLETQRERMISGNGPALLVIDEYQMIANRVRGLNYELCVALAPENTQLLMLSGSVSNPNDIVKWLTRLGRKSKLIRVSERPVPLDEQPVELLERQAQKSVGSFLARLAVAACLNDFAPLLIFAPHRQNAEKIARQIAAALPNDQPLIPPPDLQRNCPTDLKQFLKKRVAYHHSGLPYSVRAGLVEPLAKHGQLRVIVATTGLAAGINFSVRSVFVAAKTYTDGPFIREIPPDELLQMFGRAGRRGLDDQGYIFTTRDSVKPSDARAGHLRRGNVVDWPILIRVMDRAVNLEQSPFEAAERLCTTMFSEQNIRLGFEPTTENRDGSTVDDHDGSERSPFSASPTQKEILTLQSEWEKPQEEALPTPLSRCHALTKQGWRQALQLSSLVNEHIPLGNTIRFHPKDTTRPWRYLKAIVIATRPTVEKDWRVPKNLARKIRPQSAIDTDENQLLHIVAKAITSRYHGVQLLDSESTETTITARFDLANVRVDAIVDSLGNALIAPPTRIQEVAQVTDFIDPVSGELRAAPRHSPLRAWLRLGLIDRDGTPTRRGMIFSMFQRGEGLAIAAALEEPDYLASELVWHLANLRGGHRFNDLSSGESERLSAACRRIYGSLDYPRYLELGIPPGFGEGTADCLMDWIIKGQKPDLKAAEYLGSGDIERAKTEWLSLLRHIRHAPNYDWDRWIELKECAIDLLDRYAPEAKSVLPKPLSREYTQPANLKLYRV